MILICKYSPTVLLLIMINRYFSFSPTKLRLTFRLNVVAGFPLDSSQFEDHRNPSFWFDDFCSSFHLIKSSHSSLHISHLVCKSDWSPITFYQPDCLVCRGEGRVSWLRWFTVGWNTKEQMLMWTPVRPYWAVKQECSEWWWWWWSGQEPPLYLSLSVQLPGHCPACPAYHSHWTPE